MDSHDENASPARSQSVKRLSALSPFSAASPQHRRPSKQLKEQNFNRYEADPNIEMTLCEETTILEETQNKSTLETLPEESDKTLEMTPSMADELGSMVNLQNELVEKSTGASSLAEELGTIAPKEEHVTGNETPAVPEENIQIEEEEDNKTTATVCNEKESHYSTVSNPVTPVEEEFVEKEEESVETLSQDKEEQNDVKESSIYENLEIQRDAENLPTCTVTEVKESTVLETAEKEDIENETREMEETSSSVPTDEEIQYSEVSTPGKESVRGDEENNQVDDTLEISFSFGMNTSQANNTLQQVCLRLVDTVEENLLEEGSKIVASISETVELELEATDGNDVVTEKIVIVEEVITESKEENVDDVILSQSMLIKMEEECFNSSQQEDFLAAIITSELDRTTASCLSPIVGSQLESIPESPTSQPTFAQLPSSQNDIQLLAQRKPNLSESLIDFVITEKKVEYEMEAAEMTQGMEKRMKNLEQELEVMRKERDDYQFLFESTGQKNKVEMTALRQRCHELETEVDTLQQKQFNESQMVNLHDLGERLDMMMRQSETQIEIRENLTKELKLAHEKFESLEKLQEEQTVALLESQNKIENLTRQTEEMTKMTEELEEKNRLLEESEFQSVEMVEALKQDLEKEIKDHEELNEKYKKLESDMELLVKEGLNDKDTRQSQLEKEKEELSALVEDFKLKVIGLEEGLKTAEDIFRSSMDEANKSRLVLEEEIVAKTSELTAARESLEMSKIDLQNVVEDLNQTMTEFDELRQEFEEYRTQKEHLEARLLENNEKLTSEKIQLENEKKELVVKIEELEKGQKDSEAEDQTRIQLEKLTEALEAKTAELGTAETSLKLNATRLTELGAAILDLEKKTEALEEYKAYAEINKTQLQENIDRLSLEKDQLDKETIEQADLIEHLDHTANTAMEKVKEFEAAEVKLHEQIESLEKKAAERLEEYKTSAELEKVQLQENVDRLVSEKEQVQKENSELSDRLVQLEEISATASQRVRELEASEVKHLEQIQTLEKTTVELEKSSEEIWKQKMIDMQDLHSEEVGRIVKEKNELSQRCQKLEQDVEHRIDSFQQAQNQIDSLNVALKESLEQKEIIESKMANLQTSMDLSQKSLMQTIQALGEKMDSKMSNANTKELEKELKEINEKLAEMRRVAEERLKTVNELNEQVKKYQLTITDAQSQIDQLKTELTSLHTKNKELDEVVTNLTHKSEQLEDFRLQNEGFSTAGDSLKMQLEDQQKKITALESDLLKKTKDAEKAWGMCDDMDELEESYKKQLSEQAAEIQRLKEKCGEVAVTGGLLNVLRPNNIEKLSPGSVNNSHNESVSSAKEVFASPAASPAQEKTYLGNTDKTQFDHADKSPVKTNASCRQQ